MVILQNHKLPGIVWFLECDTRTELDARLFELRRMCALNIITALELHQAQHQYSLRLKEVDQPLVLIHSALAFKPIQVSA